MLMSAFCVPDMAICISAFQTSVCTKIIWGPGALHLECANPAVPVHRADASSLETFWDDARPPGMKELSLSLPLPSYFQSLSDKLVGERLVGTGILEVRSSS